MKVFCVIPTPLHGGAERVSLNLVEHFRNEHQVQICFVGPLLDENLLSTYISRSVSLNSFFLYKHTNYRNKYIRKVSLIIELALLIAKQKPDVIVSHLTYLNIVVYFAHQLSRIKSRLVLVEHTSRMLKGKYKIIAKRMWNRETVVACSKTVQESIQKISLNKPVLIYNPITTLDNAFRTSERRQNHESPTLVAVGRLSPEKNYLFLIEALEILPVAFKLEIYGFGRDPKLEDVILSKKLQNRISLKGHVLHSDLMRKYSGFSCFVMTSDYEGMPSVVIEAASCGIPVVGRKSPGLLEAIELVGGFTPDSDDPLSFARAVETAVLSGKNKRDFSEIKHLFNLDVTGHEYCRLFSD